MSKNTQEKRCRRCNEIKDASQFTRRPRNRDGLGSYCRSCKSILGEEWRKSNPEKYKAIFTRGKKKMNEKYPMKKKARMVVNNAVRDGKIPKASVLQCAECGESAKQYHHHRGYEEENWLNVIPLCRECHKS